MWDIPSPYKSAAQNPPFSRFRNFKVNLTAYIFGTKHNIRKRASALQTTRGLLHLFKTTWTYSPQTALHWKWDFTHRKFCIPLHYQSSQTQISKRNSTKFCHTVDGKSPWQSTVVNDVVTPEKIGGEKLLHLFVFSTTSTQWRECLQNERDIDHRERTLENTKGLLRCPKISWSFVHKRLKPDRTFYQPSLFRFVPLHRTPSMRH